MTQRLRQRWRIATLCLAWVLLGSTVAQGAYTEPRLALLRVTPYRSTSGIITLRLEGSFSAADALQLALPLAISITQGQLSARFDLSGAVFTRVGAGAEVRASGPGVIAIAAREIMLVLPAEFGVGPATAQATLTYEGDPISSNRLSFTL